MSKKDTATKAKYDTHDMSEHPPKRVSPKYHAVVEKIIGKPESDLADAAAIVDASYTTTCVVSADTQKQLKFELAKPEIKEVRHIFRGRELKFKTSRQVSMSI